MFAGFCKFAKFAYAKDFKVADVTGKRERLKKTQFLSPRFSS